MPNTKSRETTVANQPPNCRLVEVTGQVWEVQIDPLGCSDGGGVFQLLLDNGSIVAGRYPAEWHRDFASALQANDVILLKIAAIGEHSPDGELRRFADLRTITRCWAPAPNRLFDQQPPQWETLLGSRGAPQ